VIAAIRKQNINIPDGMVISQHSQFLIKTRGERLLKSQLANIVVAHADSGGEIHLGDIAKIATDYRERQSLFRGNGRAAIGLNLLRPEKGHVTTTMAAIEKALPTIEKGFPGIAFTIADTPKQIIETSISNMTEALRDAIIMTILVIFLILANIRLSLLAAISIPFTYCLTFAAMYVLGYELNIVTLTAVIVAVGLLLDDAIVVIENIDRHYRKLNKPLPQATIEGLKEIMLADWAGTYTTVIVLVPIMFVGGYVQQILRPFTVVLALSLLSSYIISVTVIPILAPHVIGRSKRRNWLEKGAERFDHYVIEPIGGFFAGLVHFALRHKILFIPPVIILFVVSMRFVMPLSGRDLMPPMDTGIVKIAFETDPDSSLAATETAARRIEKIVSGFDGLKMMSTMVGSEPGVVSFGTGRIPQQGMITAHFIDRFHRTQTIWEIEEEIRKKTAAIPGLKSIDVYDFGATPLSSIAATVDIMISGPDPRVLDRLADEVAARLEKARGLTTISRSWTADKNEFLLDIDLDKASRYGLDPETISFEIAAALKGTPASTLRVPGEDGYLIRVRYPEKERRNLSDLNNIYLPSRLGPVPLGEITNLVRSRTRTRFTRQDLGPTVDIYGYRATTPVTFLQANVEEVLKGLVMPPGYRLSHEGEVKNMGEAGIRLAQALGLAIILLYFSLVPTFRSWLNPVTIMIAIPLSMIGGAWGLLISGQHACMPANMGMILLAGIVVNNSILLIDFIEQARAQGAELLDAVEQAVRIRTRPILMTAISTIVGMLPIAAQRALGLERLSPLAVVAIGGLLVSTFLTLVYIPLFYTLVDRLRQKFSKVPVRPEAATTGTGS
jgi:multidrug efflux pump subunit AcrB